MPVIDSETRSGNNDWAILDSALGLFVAAIIVNHFLWVWHYAASVPVNDDYVLILNRLIMYHNLPPGRALGFLLDFSGGQQHRLVFLTLVIVALFKVFGHVDFHALIFIGNSFLLILLWGIWKFAGSDLPVGKNRAAYFLPAALLVISPAYYEASLWATGVLQNLPVLMFAFFAVAYSARQSNGALLIALIAALLASGSSANGMAAILVCALVLASQKHYSRALLMVLIFVAVAWAYTRGFPSDPSNYGGSGSPPGELLEFFLALCGSVIWGKNGAVIFGAMIAIGFGALSWKGLARRSPVLWGLGLFLLISMAMMSIGRSGLSIDAALVSRYKPYSGLMLLVDYMGALILVPSVVWKRAAGFFGLLISGTIFIAYSIHNNAPVTNFWLYPKLSMAYRGIEGKVQVVSGFPGTEFANIIINAAEMDGLYRPGRFSDLVVQSVPPTETIARSVQQQSDLTESDMQINEFIDGEEATLVYGVVAGVCAREPLRIALKNGDQILSFKAGPPDFGWLGMFARHGFVGGIVDKRSLAAGRYQLGVIVAAILQHFLEADTWWPEIHDTFYSASICIRRPL